jgi:hypothetical protein
VRTFTTRVVLVVWGLLLCSIASPAQETAVVELNRVRLYLPDADLNRRLGTDVKPLASYIKAIEAEAAGFFEKAGRPKAKGLFVVVGVKPEKKVKVWCEAVDGEIPAAVIARLEATLGDVPTVAVRQGPIAFAMEVKLWGQTPAKFPEIPRVWAETAKRSKEPLTIPDGLFTVLWP